MKEIKALSAILKEKFDISFNNEALLVEAMTHSSYANEHKEMKGIYTSCISKDTLDEAPFAYRGIDYIKEVIKDTVEVENVLTTIFNYKGGDRK